MSPRAAVRRRFQPLPWVLLTGVWVLLWGNLSWGNVLAGVLVGAVVLLVFPLPPVSLEVRIRPWPLVVLVVVFTFDLVRASIEVAFKAVAPWVRPHGRLLRVRLRSDEDLFCVVTAEMTALVPGTIVVDLHPEGRELFVHVFDAPSEAALDRVRDRIHAQEERVLLALAAHYHHIMAGREVPRSEMSPEELAALEEEELAALREGES